MLVKENAENISLLIDRLFEFVNTDEDIQKDLLLYFNSYPSQITSQAHLQSLILPYIFDRFLENTGKKVTDIFIEKNPSLSNEDLEVINGLSKSVSSVYEIKKVLKNGFELYSLVNEKTYAALSLVKMVHFRGVTSGQFLEGRIFPYKNDYYLIEINNVFSEKSKYQAYKTAVMKQLEDPELLYSGNDNKLAEIQITIADMSVKFSKYFGMTEFVTTTEYVDDLLGYFNDFVENPEQKQDIDISDYIKIPEKYAYFDVKEITSGSNDIIEAAAGGFASHEKIYDVGVMFDDKLGLLILPFYGTFREIFKAEDYKSIEGYKECILNYFESVRIPPVPIMNVYNENPDNFMKIVSEALELDTKTSIDELIHKYKHEYFTKIRFSSPTVLYSSKSFAVLMEDSARMQTAKPQIKVRAGRNEPCPCGSGKKYKKCCLLKINV